MDEIKIDKIINYELENYNTIQTRFRKLLKLKWWEKYDIKFWILISKLKSFKQK